MRRAVLARDAVNLDGLLVRLAGALVRVAVVAAGGRGRRRRGRRGRRAGRGRAGGGDGLAEAAVRERLAGVVAAAGGFALRPGVGVAAACLVLLAFLASNCAILAAMSSAGMVTGICVRCLVFFSFFLYDF